MRAAGSLAASVERRQPVRGEIIDFYVAPAAPVKLSRMFRRGNPLFFATQPRIQGVSKDARSTPVANQYFGCAQRMF